MYSDIALREFVASQPNRAILMDEVLHFNSRLPAPNSCALRGTFCVENFA